MGKPRKTPDDYKALAANLGYTFIEMIFDAGKTKGRVRCPNGHIRIETYRRLTIYGCGQCDSSRKKTIEDYQSLANARGLMFLGEARCASGNIGRWRCSCGHEWFAKFHDIDIGHGCTKCGRLIAADKKRHKPVSYHVLAMSRGYSWLGPEVKSYFEKTGWRCSVGHEWLASYNTLQGTTYGCPVCAGHQPRVSDDYHALGAALDLEWVGPAVPSGKYKTHWRCLYGHEWVASYNRVHSSKGCPQCRHYVNGFPTSHPQRQLGEMLSGEINHRVKRYAIDVAIERNGIQICVEYDCAFYHDPARDAKRDTFLQSRGWRILRVKSGNLLPTLDQLNVAIDRLVAGSLYEEIVLPDWKGD